MKIYKVNNKLAVYVPQEVAEKIGITEGDEVYFKKFSEDAFLFTKKDADSASAVGGAAIVPRKEEQQHTSGMPQQGAEPSQEEIAVLKKLDTVRYGKRDRATVSALLTGREKEILKKLEDSRMVTLFWNGKENKELYGISRGIYDRFLMRKKERPQQQGQQRQRYRILVSSGAENDEEIKALEENGFVVLLTEAEAARLSLALEESVRRGIVIGTRAFNKKFYIVAREFFNRNLSGIIKTLRSGDRRVQDLASEMGISDDAAKACLSLLAESGEVREKKRDLFSLA